MVFPAVCGVAECGWLVQTPLPSSSLGQGKAGPAPAKGFLWRVPGAGEGLRSSRDHSLAPVKGFFGGAFRAERGCPGSSHPSTETPQSRDVPRHRRRKWLQEMEFLLRSGMVLRKAFIPFTGQRRNTAALFSQHNPFQSPPSAPKGAH